MMTRIPWLGKPLHAGVAAPSAGAMMTCVRPDRDSVTAMLLAPSQG